MLFLLLIWTSFQPPGPNTALSITAHRPPPSSWKRTLCGSPSGGEAKPAGPYQVGIDHAGADISPCGSEGCVLNASATHAACEAMCNNTKGCHAYVFAPAACSGEAGPICWVKSAADGAGSKSTCRNSRALAQPAVQQPDIPSKWAAEVSADATPLIAYPRPQMARGSGTAAELRERGDPAAWTNLNGLWEWEATDSTAPPFGRTLSGSILVPFPVESCLSGVAPNSSAAIVQQMWCVPSTAPPPPPPACPRLHLPF